jgi:hypothetical protein
VSTPNAFTGWRKSSHSKDDAECVEVGAVAGTDVIGVRDTTHNGRGPILVFSQAEWGLFMDRLKAGEGRPS